MQIRFDQEMGTYLYFPPNELRVALGVLKAIHKVCPMEFLVTAINDIEVYLRPKVVPMTNYHHICEHCFRDLDQRDPNSYLMTVRSLNGEETQKWVHYECKPINKDRPV